MTAEPTGKMVELQIKRQEKADAPAHWESFRIKWRPNLNVIAMLMDIQLSPVTADGKKTTPVAWESACLEEVCGSCSMIINGRPRQACTALVDQIAQPIRIEPFTKFPLIRDLMVDRTRMFDHLKKIKAWVDIDGTYELGPGPKYSPSLAAERYVQSTCFTCGCCLESCAQ